LGQGEGGLSVGENWVEFLIFGREQADTAISQKNLKTVLYLLGISGRDLADLH
jgi:hypothetical protein